MDVDGYSVRLGSLDTLTGGQVFDVLEIISHVVSRTNDWSTITIEVARKADFLYG